MSLFTIDEPPVIRYASARFFNVKKVVTRHDGAFSITVAGGACDRIV
jgi:hypothetical protein